MSSDVSPGMPIPRREDRGFLDFVIKEFPFPIAVTYYRLNESLDRQAPIDAHLQLRDAVECVLKVIASIAVADYLRRPLDQDYTGKLLQILFQNLSIGHWCDLIERALKDPLDPYMRENRLDESGRLLPGLACVFYETHAGGRLRPTSLNKRIRSDQDSFVTWRNRVIGHGVFRNDPEWYAAETLKWLPLLHDLYRALAPNLSDWSLRSLTPSGEELHWDGLTSMPSTEKHVHTEWEEPLPTYLVNRLIRPSSFPWHLCSRSSFVLTVASLGPSFLIETSMTQDVSDIVSSALNTMTDTRTTS